MRSVVVGAGRSHPEQTMTRKNRRKKSARARQEKLGGSYQAHLRHVDTGAQGAIKESSTVQNKLRVTSRFLVESNASPERLALFAAALSSLGIRNSRAQPVMTTLTKRTCPNVSRRGYWRTCDCFRGMSSLFDHREVFLIDVDGARERILVAHPYEPEFEEDSRKGAALLAEHHLGLLSMPCTASWYFPRRTCVVITAADRIVPAIESRLRGLGCIRWPVTS